MPKTVVVGTASLLPASDAVNCSTIKSKMSSSTFDLEYDGRVDKQIYESMIVVDNVLGCEMAVTLCYIYAQSSCLLECSLYSV